MKEFVGAEIEREGSPARVALASTMQDVEAATGPPMPNPVAWPKLTMISALQSGHGFVFTGQGTANLNDTTDAFIGSQSIRLTTNGAGNPGDLTKTGLTLDMTAGKGFLYG